MDRPDSVVYCVVFTAHKTATIGYIDENAQPGGDPIIVHEARLLIRWRGGGVFRVAAEGPRAEDEITTAAPWSRVSSATSIVACSGAAEAALRALP